jgi:hypothetical protein
VRNKIATVVVLAAAIGLAIARRSPAAPSDPQDAVYAMLDAARSGDVKTYLASYTGQTEAALRRTASESPTFSKYLQDSVAGVKGIVVSDPQPVTDQQVQVKVEYVYEKRNESQTLYLEKGTRGWKIVRTDAEERIQAPVPYGTRVR